VGIVVHPAEAVARRKAVDEAGVVHHYDEVLLGEAMQDGPVMLSWPAVQGAGREGHATSVVIHEFVHKIDMKNGGADGSPPLPPGFMGTANARAAHAAWRAAWEPAYEQFRERVVIAERFGGEWPWLDAYGATAPAEFFAVACEAYFVHRERFAQEFPTLLPVLDALFRPAQGLQAE
jgi:Mlc titration factor MtfA (ptsG expression regulator)